jgi:hypothetical protein
MPPEPTAERRIATLERRLGYCRKFADDAYRHIPALVAGKPDSGEYKAAVAWWERCNVRPVLSSS